MKSKFYWNGGSKRIVKVTAICNSADTGASNPRVNITINGDAVLTANTNAGIEATETLATSGIGINTSNYDVADGDLIEITTDANGASNDASDLTISCIGIAI
jgi:hypothetical protein